MKAELRDPTKIPSLLMAYQSDYLSLTPDLPSRDKRPPRYRRAATIY